MSSLLRNPRGAGRKPLPPGEKKVKITVSIEQSTYGTLKHAGEGNVSKGVETMLRSARHANLTQSHKRAPKMEREHAKKIGADLVSGSGVGHVKGDIRKKGVARIECKTTSKGSFSVTRQLIAKLEDAIVGANEVPAIVIEFNDGRGKPQATVAVIPIYALHDLLSR